MIDEALASGSNSDINELIDLCKPYINFMLDLHVFIEENHAFIRDFILRATTKPYKVQNEMDTFQVTEAPRVLKDEELKEWFASDMYE